MNVVENVTLNKTDQNKWFKNIVVFLAPVGILYISTIIGVISQDNHSVSVNDFIPTQVATGGIILWFLNAALDYLRKLTSK